MATSNIRWRKDPGPKDFQAAKTYLGLVFPDADAAEFVRRLRRTSTTFQKPKDIERASGLRILPRDDPEVRKELKKSKAKPLTPVLLIRGDGTRGRPLIVGDGYHRICASYYADRDAEIPCRIVDL